MLWILDVEAVVSGLFILATEVYIVVRLARTGRVQWSYHLVPTAHGACLLWAVAAPGWLELQVTAFALATVTTLNVYNTWIPQVVTTVDHMVLDQSPQATPTLVFDLLLPRYRPSFAPWGYVLQFLYSCMMLMHVAFRSAAFAHVLRAMTAA